MFRLITFVKQRGIRTKHLIFVTSSILLLTAAVVFTLDITASAESETVFTGCLNRRSGELHKVAIGFEPFIPCSSTEVQVTWDRGAPALEGLIAALEERIAQIENYLAPLDLTVNCPEESVGEALAQVAGRTAHVTITVVGVCTEEVVISRDDTTLRGASPGDGLQAPSPDDFVLTLLGARRINLRQLTITGGNIGLLATNGASFDAGELFISETSNAGVIVQANATGDLYNSRVENTGLRGIVASGGGVLWVYGGTIDTNTLTGVEARSGGNVTLWEGTTVRNSGIVAISAGRGGSIVIQNGIVENNDFGVHAIGGGHVSILDGSMIQNNLKGGVAALSGGTVGIGSATVANNPGRGVQTGSGSSLSLQDAIIEDNGSDGVILGGGSSAEISYGTIVRNNLGHGIALDTTCTAAFDNTVQIIGNAGTAVICFPGSFAQITGTPGIISGNGSDAIECP